MASRHVICMFTNTVCIFLFLFSSTRCHGFTSFDGKECEPVDETGCQCKFTDESAKVVDLTSLGNTDDTPRFQGVQGSDGNSYSYNPCNGFTLGQCDNAAMCVVEGSTYSQIGDAGNTQFQYNEEDDSVSAAYVTRRSIITASVVKLICDPTACDAVFTPQGQTTVGMYNFEFKSVCSCPGMCDANGPIASCQPSPGSGSGSTGPSVFILIGLVGIMVFYLIGGMLYMKVVRKESGTNIIPNKNMWMNFFGLIKTGFLFSISKCRREQYNGI